jgi:hypothetical protein
MKRIIILRIIAGLMLSVFIFLFIHSETDFFDRHTDKCKDLDLCLILDKASFDNHHHFNKLSKLHIDISHEYLSIAAKSYVSYSDKGFLAPNYFITSPNNILLKNKILLI